MRQVAFVVLIAVAVGLGVTAQAQAGIWTPVGSGTTQDITAVDYRGPGDILYATAGGQILRNGAVQLNAPGVQFTDIALNPAGTRGLATAATGKLYRFNGATWSAVSLIDTTYPHTCGGAPTPVRNATPTGNLNAVTWAAASTAYVVGADRGVVLKTTDDGATFLDVSRRSDGTCRADPGSDAFTDIQAVTDQLLYLVSSNFGARRITTDAFTSTTAPRNDSAVNCPGVPSRIGIDLESANRSWVVGACSGSLAFGFSSDSGTTYDLSLDYPNANPSELTGLRDVSVAGGSAVAVGNSGAILVSTDGRSAYLQRADGTGAAADWLAVDKRSASDAAVVGRGGRLLVSAQANAIPDIVAPAGTISGPVNVVAGRPATFTANVADDAGGSGINLASFAWSSSGVPSATGNPASLAFPSAGFFSVRVTFTDNAGNAGEATLGVSVTSPPPPPPPPPPSKPKTTPGTRTITVDGAKVTLKGPSKCVPANTAFTATLSFKRAKKKGSKVIKVFRTDFFVDGKRKKLDKKAPFRQRLTVKKLKPGSKHTLKARAFLKVRKGKSPTKSITTRFTVCG